MTRWARYVPLGIVIGVVMVLVAQLVWLAGQPAKDPVQPAPDIIAAWETAGAEFGCISVDERGWGHLEWRSGKEKPVAGALPAFRVTVFPTGKLKDLPPPGVPFGLRLLDPKKNQATDAGLKELAGLKQLQTLDLSSTQVTDAGLKELAGLKQLQTLDLKLGTTAIKLRQVTDTGLKELAGLTQLQWLNLYGSLVTDAGLKELAGLTQLRTLILDYTRATLTGQNDLAGGCDHGLWV